MKLTQELIEQAKACTTIEECEAFLKNNKIELSVEDLKMLSGGVWDSVKNRFNDGTVAIIENEHDDSGGSGGSGGATGGW